LLTRYTAPIGADACLLIVKPTAFTIEREKQGEVVFLISFVGSPEGAGDEIAIQKSPHGNAAKSRHAPRDNYMNKNTDI